ncbi:MAG: asparaginase, partial [Terriglobales bacterium]
LMSHLSSVKNAYPQLQPEHLAIMMSSHNAEPMHIALLNEVMQTTGVREEWLQCPRAYPQETESRRRLKEEGIAPRRLYHNCSGKHFGYLLQMKTLGVPLESYTSFDAPHFVALKKLISHLLHHQGHELPATTDGCQLPNFGVSIYEMASLYQGLANGSVRSFEGTEGIGVTLDDVTQIRALMLQFPLIIGGSDRLDSKLMQGYGQLRQDVRVIAKEGADGLLAVGVSACEKFPHGLGILIKLASGFDARHMEVILREILAQLGLADHHDPVPKQPEGTRTDHLSARFYFNLSSCAGSRGEAQHLFAAPLSELAARC